MHKYVEEGHFVTTMCHKLHLDQKALCSRVDFLIKSLKYGDEMTTLSSRLKAEGSSVATQCEEAMKTLQAELEGLEEQQQMFKEEYSADITFSEESYARAMALDEEKITLKAQVHMASNLKERIADERAKLKTSTPTPAQFEPPGLSPINQSHATPPKHWMILKPTFREQLDAVAGSKRETYCETNCGLLKSHGAEYNGENATTEEKKKSEEQAIAGSKSRTEEGKEPAEKEEAKPQTKGIVEGKATTDKRTGGESKNLKIEEATKVEGVSEESDERGKKEETELVDMYNNGEESDEDDQPKTKSETEAKEKGSTTSSEESVTVVEEEEDSEDEVSNDACSECHTSGVLYRCIGIPGRQCNKHQHEECFPLLNQQRCRHCIQRNKHDNTSEESSSDPPEEEEEEEDQASDSEYEEGGLRKKNATKKQKAKTQESKKATQVKDKEEEKKPPKKTKEKVVEKKPNQTQPTISEGFAIGTGGKWMARKGREY
jgi:hypothetical protein